MNRPRRCQVCSSYRVIFHSLVLYVCFSRFYFKLTWKVILLFWHEQKKNTHWERNTLHKKKKEPVKKSSSISLIRPFISIHTGHGFSRICLNFYALPFYYESCAICILYLLWSYALDVCAQCMNRNIESVYRVLSTSQRFDTHRNWCGVSFLIKFKLHLHYSTTIECLAQKVCLYVEFNHYLC